MHASYSDVIKQNAGSVEQKIENVAKIKKPRPKSGLKTASAEV